MLLYVRKRTIVNGKNKNHIEKMKPEKSSTSLKKRVKKLVLKGYKSTDIEHPLFDVGKTEAKRLLITTRGLKELRQYDRTLHSALTRWVEKEKVTSKELSKLLNRWITQFKIRTGDTKSVYRKPGRVYHTLTKTGSVQRPLQLIHMDLADVNRLNPDRKKYRYPFILVAVDGFSNYSVLVPVKNKTAKQVLNATKNAFSQFGLKKVQIGRKLRSAKYADLRKCMTTTRIQTDRGTEFFNKDLKGFLQKRGYELFSTRGSKKAYLAESKIGQMKRQLIRIQNILEDSTDKRVKKYKKKSGKIAKNRRNKTSRPGKEEKEASDDGELFVDYKIYEGDWSKHLRKLQNKINNKINRRTGFSPTQLFNQFSSNAYNDNISKRNKRMPNETDKKFEPISDTLTKMVLLRDGATANSSKQRKLSKVIKKSAQKGKNPNLRWKRKVLNVGDRVYLTYSRLKGYPNEKALNVFEKKSTQTKSEWNTNHSYIVDTVYKGFTKHDPVRYRVKNAKTNVPRRTLYYREELLLAKK